MFSYSRALGAIRLGVGVFLLVTLVVQIVDLSIGRSLVPNEYFTFFTIDSTILNIVVLIVGGIVVLRGGRSPVLEVASMAIVPAAVITGAVYNVMLRGLPAEKYLGMDWPNEVLHVGVPAFLVIDWFVLRSLDPDRPRLSFTALGAAAAFPLLWLGFTMLRGALTGWFPYPFLEPDGPGGGTAVVGWIVGLFAGILVLAALAIATTRLPRRHHHSALAPPPLVE